MRSRARRSVGGLCVAGALACFSFLAAPGTSDANGNAVHGGNLHRLNTREGISPDDTGASGTWQQVQNVPSGIIPGEMLLLTDGRILVQDDGQKYNSGTNNWWTLTPDSSGNYSDGTWTQVASSPADFQPLYYASGVLSNGNVVIEGGEVNGLPYPADVLYSNEDSNLGAIYNPVSNSWTAVAPPDGGLGEWARIGDVPSVVLPNGSFMIGNQDNPDGGASDQALLNPTTLHWTITGAGFTGRNCEAGFTLLPNNDVLEIDTTIPSTNNSEIYDTKTAHWSSGGIVPSPLAEPTPVTTGFGNQGISEMGPALVMPDGLTFVTGATPNTDIYDSRNGTWTAGPDVPSVGGVAYSAQDNSAVILPNGDVLFSGATYPGDTGPVHFFLYNGSSITQISDPPDNAAELNSSIGGDIIDLPTGQALWDSQVNTGMFIYTAPASTPNTSWLPVVTKVATELSPGQTFSLSGEQLSGLTDGEESGDERQNPTNYPLVQLTNTSSGDVSYARSFDFSSTSIAPGTPSTFRFELPTTIATGSYELRVNASGFTSAPVAVTVSPQTTTSTTIVKRTRSSIICRKGKLTKRVTGFKPVCPSGYKKIQKK